MNGLVSDVLVRIALNLPISNVLSFISTNKEVRQLYDNEHFWKVYGEKYFFVHYSLSDRAIVKFLYKTIKTINTTGTMITKLCLLILSDLIVNNHITLKQGKDFLIGKLRTKKICISCYHLYEIPTLGRNIIDDYIKKYNILPEIPFKLPLLEKVFNIDLNVICYNTLRERKRLTDYLHQDTIYCSYKGNIVYPYDIDRSYLLFSTLKDYRGNSYLSFFNNDIKDWQNSKAIYDLLEPRYLAVIHLIQERMLLDWEHE